jgi:soluble lytic murein transglycosylase-like protein
MQKTANLLFMMMVLLFVSFRSPMDSISIATEVRRESATEVYNKFIERREQDRRAVIEQQLYDSLSNKSSIKWLLTGFTESQIHYESRGNQDAVSSEGAIGIAQFMPDTWNALIEKKYIPEWFDINNEKHQRIAQLVYLDHLYTIWYQRSDDRKALTVASYNAGPGAIFELVNKYGSEWRDYLPEETTKYLNYLKRYI